MSCLRRLCSKLTSVTMLIALGLSHGRMSLFGTTRSLGLSWWSAILEESSQLSSPFSPMRFGASIDGMSSSLLEQCEHTLLRPRSCLRRSCWWDSQSISSSWMLSHMQMGPGKWRQSKCHDIDMRALKESSLGTKPHDPSK